MSELTAHDIAFSYGTAAILEGVSFDVKPGELVAILGPNGMGKTTFLKCINHILTPKRGTIMVGEDSVTDLTPRQIAQRIGYVEQQRTGTQMTVFNAVLLGRKPYITWDVTESDLEIVNEALHTLGLQKFAMRRLNQLSGGELQKVVIARAIAQQPEVLLLDEPTNNLDLKNQVEVLDVVRHLVDKHRTASVVVIHDLNLALRYADRFLLMKDKKVFAFGGPEVMTEANIEAVYDVDVSMITQEGLTVVVPFSTKGN
ncbi:MAG: ABC transporter ATP-binding protein [Actinomycetaceae bacterium]|nr:ABC transporter ATP-binding protein [Actinomycetaceae bacterium]